MRHLPYDECTDVDICLLDGAVFRLDAAGGSGVPRADFFIMCVDVEYPLRLAKDGWRQLVLSDGAHGALQVGDAEVRESGAQWRRYYQTRNHLRMALDLRSPKLMGGFAIRSLKQLVRELPADKFRPAGTALRLRGVRDGLAKRMGPSVLPPGHP